MKLFGKFFLIAAAFVFSSMAATSAHATLPEQEIYYEARQQPLYEVFQDVSLALDVPVVIVNLPEQIIEGVYQAPDARTRDDDLCRPCLHCRPPACILATLGLPPVRLPSIGQGRRGIKPPVR